MEQIATHLPRRIGRGAPAHLPHHSHFEPLLHKPPYVNVQAVHWDGRGHEVVVRRRVNVEVLGRNLCVPLKQPELVAALHTYL